MTGNDHFLKLVVIIGLAIGGMLLTMVLSIMLLGSTGLSMPDIMELMNNGMEGVSAGVMRALIAIQHVSIFIVPGFVFGIFFYRPKILQGFDLSRLPGGFIAFMGILFLIAAYPLVNLSFALNESLPLPSWARDFENQAADTMKTILEMNSPLIFLINLSLIAILPGIGEELLFRGIIQKQISGWLKNPIIGIWLSAMIFSAIHMQFEGFLPRLVLGVTLGYLYHWTKNLWVPIIAHAFNNGIQVILIYTMGMDLSEIEEQGSEDLQWWMIVISIVAMFFISLSIKRNVRTHG